MNKRTPIPREQILQYIHLPCHEAAKHLGCTKKYLHQRARMLCLKFQSTIAEPPPAFLDRRCPCGTVFQCRDVRKERICEACEEALAA